MVGNKLLQKKDAPASIKPDGKYYRKLYSYNCLQVYLPSEKSRGKNSLKVSDSENDLIYCNIIRQRPNSSSVKNSGKTTGSKSSGRG